MCDRCKGVNIKVSCNLKCDHQSQTMEVQFLWDEKKPCHDPEDLPPSQNISCQYLSKGSTNSLLTQMFTGGSVTYTFVLACLLVRLLIEKKIKPQAAAVNGGQF